MSAGTTARMRREGRRAALSRQLVRLLACHDVTQDQIAGATGAKASVVQRWTDRERPETPSLADLPGIAAASRGFAIDLLRSAVEEIGLVVAERVEAAGPMAWFAALGGALDAAHGVQRAILDGIATDGEAGPDLSTGELEAIEAKLAKLEAVAASMREQLEAERARRTGDAGTPARGLHGVARY